MLGEPLGREQRPRELAVRRARGIQRVREGHDGDVEIPRPAGTRQDWEDYGTSLSFDAGTRPEGETSEEIQIRAFCAWCRRDGGSKG